MSYVIPTSYVGFDTISGADIRNNYAEARRWLCGNMLFDDVAQQAVTTDKIERPDRVFSSGNQVHGATGNIDHLGSVLEVRFTSGFYSCTTTPINIEAATILTCQFKQNAVSTKTQYNSIPNAGRQFTLEHRAFCVVNVWCPPLCFANPNPVFDNKGDSNQFMLYVDDAQQQETNSYVADRDSAVTTGEPGHTGLTTSRQSIVCFNWAGYLEAGTHIIDMRVNCRLEFALINDITFEIQCHWAET